MNLYNICIFNISFLCLLQIYIMVITEEVSSLRVFSSSHKHPLAMKTSNRSSSYRPNISFISNKSTFLTLSVQIQHLKSKSLIIICLYLFNFLFDFVFHDILFLLSHIYLTVSFNVSVFFSASLFRWIIPNVWLILVWWCVGKLQGILNRKGLHFPIM